VTRHPSSVGTCRKRCWVHFPVPPSRGLGLCPELLCEGLSRTTTDMFTCRVESCGLRQRSSVGESRHFRRDTAVTYPPSILRMYLSTQDASRPTTTDLYYMARTTTIECWAVKMRLRLTVLVLPAGMSGQSGGLKHSHRMFFSSFPGRLRVGTAVGMRVDGNHLHRRGTRVKMTAGSGGSDGGGIIALETVLLEVDVFHMMMDVPWTLLTSSPTHQCREPRLRVLTLCWEVESDYQRVIVARPEMTVTLTVACVTTCSRATSASLMQTSPHWPFLCWGGVALSRGIEIVFGTSSSMPVLSAAGG